MSANQAPAVKMGKGPEDVVFFGKIDRKGQRADGEIGSSYASWYSDQQIEALQEQVSSTERQLELGLVPKNSEHEARELLRLRKQKLEDIEASRPRLNAAQLAWVKSVSGDLECKIQESEFSYDAMNFGEASPFDEMKRMTRGCIKIDPMLAKKFGCKVSENGTVSRNEAKRVLKHINKLVGKPTNMEYLRRKELTCRTQRVDPFVGSVGGDVGRETAASDSA